MTGRCPDYSGDMGCCREEYHPGDHCTHPGDQLTGAAGLVVASRSGPRFRRCDGTHGGELPQHPGPGRLGAEGRAARRWAEEYLNEQPDDRKDRS